MADTTQRDRRAALAWWPSAVPSLIDAPLPPQLRVPLSIHSPAGAPVPSGTQVCQGDALATTTAADATFPVAPVGGRLGGLAQVALVSGRHNPAVVLEPATVAAIAPAVDGAHAAEQADNDHFRHAVADDLGEWIERLRRANISADRRNSPNLIAQLTAALRRPIDTIICSALDSDPTLRLNATLAVAQPADLEACLTLLARLTGAGRTCLVMEAWGPPAWSLPVRRALTPSPARIAELANDYPQPDPSLLIYTLLRRRLRPGRLPAEQGVVLLDTAAAVAIGRLARGLPPMRTVPMAIRDRRAGVSHYISAVEGTPLAFLLDWLGIADGDRLLRGGDMLRDLRTFDDAVVAGSDERVVHVASSESNINPDPCIRCGWCVESCPTRVHPAILLEAAQYGDSRLAVRGGIDACIECGICVHVCPSRLPLLAGIRSIKAARE